MVVGESVYACDEEIKYLVMVMVLSLSLGLVFWLWVWFGFEDFIPISASLYVSPSLVFIIARQFLCHLSACIC
jgi:hypothetical protein